MYENDGTVDWMDAGFHQPDSHVELLYCQHHHYDPDEPIKSWQRIQREGDGNDKIALESWKKNIKVSIKDFPIFKDPVYWKRFSRQFIVTLDSFNLRHIVDRNAKAPGTELVEAQMRWGYKMMQDVIQEPHAKSIVIKSQ